MNLPITLVMPDCCKVINNFTAFDSFILINYKLIFFAPYPSHQHNKHSQKKLNYEKKTNHSNLEHHMIQKKKLHTTISFVVEYHHLNKSCITKLFTKIIRNKNIGRNRLVFHIPFIIFQKSINQIRNSSGVPSGGRRSRAIGKWIVMHPESTLQNYLPIMHSLCASAFHLAPNDTTCHYPE